MIEAFPGKVRVVIKQHPLPMHSKAKLGAEAVLAANDQGKFKQMHDFLLKNFRSLGRPMIEEEARRLGLDMTRFNKALDTDAHKDQIASETREALALGARGTPASFVNGIYVKGAQPYEVFRQKVEAELRKQK